MNPIISNAQKTEKINVVKYSDENGLTGYNIRKIIQDKFGFLWLATQDGIYRFDGTNFTFYQKNAIAKRKLLGADVRDLLLDSTANVIWALSGQGGLNAIDCVTGHVIKSIAINSTDDEDWNMSMTMAAGKIWIGTFNNLKIYHLSTNKFETAPVLQIPGNSKKGFYIRNIHTDPYGNIWVGITGYGIIIIHPKTKQVLRHISFPPVNGLPAVRILTALHTSPGTALLGTNQGLRKITYDKNYNFNVDDHPCKPVPVINKALITVISAHEKKQLLIATDQHLYKFSSDLTTYTILEELQRKNNNEWLSSVVSINTDSLYNIWLGCSQGLAFIKQGQQPFCTAYRDNNATYTLKHVYGVVPLSDTLLLIGHSEGLALYNLPRNRFETIDSNACYYLQKGPGNQVFISNSSGIYIYQQRHLTPVSHIYPEFTPYADWSLSCYTPLSDTLVMLGTENFKGMLIWNRNSHRIKEAGTTTSNIRLAADIVNTIYKDRKNQVWVLSDKAITLFKDDFNNRRIINYKDPATNQPYNIFFDICEAGGYYWLATYGMGILQIDSNYTIRHIFSTKDGLCNNGVYKIFNYKDSVLVITSNNGISLFDINRYTFRNYFESDGLHGNAFEEACGTYVDDKVYVGGINGVSILNLPVLTTNTRPPVIYPNTISMVSENGEVDTSNLLMKELYIPANVLQTNISFSVLNNASPGKVRLMYRIDELNNNWTELGNQRFINLIDIRPGNYTLSVKAANEDGYWNTHPVQLLLHFQPKWYQTWWFKAFLLLVIISILYGLYYTRISQIKKQQQIRKDIAGDLHDDIGSTLNIIKVFTHLARRQPENFFYLQQIEESLVHATAGLRDMIWVLDESDDTVYELSERIKQLILPVTNVQQICLEASIADSARNIILSKIEKRNLLLIARETVNNAIKYAGCTIIRLEFSLADGRLAMTIADNGRGFDVNVGTTGNGLKNIRQRAKQIRYKADISSSDKGTSIMILKK